jgi:hypothetical protein
MTDRTGLLVYRVLDDIVQAVGAPDRAADVARARQEWEERRGRLFEDEHLWEAWTTAFLEWYALERSADGGSPPVAASMLEKETDADRASALRAWLRSLRTLVEVHAVGNGRVDVIDLLGGARISVVEQRALAGVGRGDVAEVRMVAADGVIRFGRTFWFHPAGTRAVIAARVEELEVAQQTRDEILDHLARLRIRCERYAHVAPGKIFASTDDRIPERSRA